NLSGCPLPAIFFLTPHWTFLCEAFKLENIFFYMSSTTINIQKLVKGKYTYPSWSTNSTYQLRSRICGNEIEVYYITKSNRKISRIFPKHISISHRLSYVLGFLKGEGSNSLGKSNYRRFTITNTDPEIMKFVLMELDRNDLFHTIDLIDKSVHLLHFTLPYKKVIEYWSNKLNLNKNKFKCFHDEKRTSPYGVCHIYISDVLLRRIVDLIHEKIMS
ncbi:MAG: hypothetical protein KJ709_09045, partial [Nanoarchaeota archaeon]|nr:hypothetical protein [Nanoarchaeota archaeon]